MTISFDQLQQWKNADADVTRLEGELEKARKLEAELRGYLYTQMLGKTVQYVVDLEGRLYRLAIADLAVPLEIRQCPVIIEGKS